jgi:hypothetical protein
LPTEVATKIAAAILLHECQNAAYPSLNTLDDPLTRSLHLEAFTELLKEILADDYYDDEADA